MIIYCDGLLCCTIVVSAFFFNRTWTLRCCLVAVPFRGSAESMTRQHNTLVLKSRQQQHPRFACVIPRVCEYLLGNAENILSSSHVKRTSKGFVAVNEELRQQRHDRYRSLFYDWGHSLGQPFFATLSLRIGCSGIVIVNFFGSIFGKMTVSFVPLPPVSHGQHWVPVTCCTGNSREYFTSYHCHISPQLLRAEQSAK